MAEIILTPHQQEQHDKAIQFIRDGHKRILIKGSAGCGKTVLATAIIKTLKRDRTIVSQYNNGMVFVTAPTHKALSVLQSKVDTAVEFKTIHSALKLRRWIDSKTGEEMFVPNKSGGKYGKQDDFMICKACIIDECSMLSKKFIGGYKDPKTGKFYPGYLDNLNIIIIFIGDEKQLNPVKEDYSPAFHQGWPEVELTEIIRQGEGNPIIDLSRDLDLIFFRQPRVINGKGYIYDNDRAGIIENLAEVNGTDDFKFLGYTNAKVDETNKLVRERRYGKPAKVEKQETIVFNSPFGEFYTNKELKVTDLDIYTDFIKIPSYNTKFDNENVPVGNLDKLKMKFYKINGVVTIIHEHSEMVFKQIAEHIKKNCMQKGWDWRGWYWFVEQFADIKYNHALTIHKSQGSTYKESVIDIKDVNINQNLAEKKRMLYTGVTRSSHLLILHNVGVK